MQILTHYKYFFKNSNTFLILGGKYVAASGFTPDVKVWSIKFNKSGGFEKAQRAFELTGHTSGIYHFTWRNDSARVATISKDGTWRLYNVEVDLHLGKWTTSGPPINYLSYRPMPITDIDKY